MKLLDMKTLLNNAEKKESGIAAINVSNVETINAVMEAASIVNYPVILQVAPIQLNVQKISYTEIVEIIKILGKKYDVKTAIHLDHAETVEDCIEAIDAGFTSVMYDGSNVSLDKNVENSKKVVAYAKKRNVTVEAELGRVAGAEGVEVDSIKGLMTDPKLASFFVESTDVDCLAVSIGNAHGHYKYEPKLDFERLKKIKEQAKIPLVLHGGTGIPDKDIKKAISLGIRKINFFTEIDSEFVKGFVDAYEKNKKIYMMNAQESGRQRMIKKSLEKIKLCMSR